jgi:SAM-dependent methyltransferase
MENLGARSEQDLAESPYILDNAGREALSRFQALSDIFDRGTIRHFEELGVSSGWNCLEVGGGSGSIAAWLAARIAPAGNLLITDIDPRFLESQKIDNVEVRQHNIVTDPLPEAAFDLIHARLVLVHLPERERVLSRMVAALKPGGWLLDEEIDISLFPDPTSFPEEVLSKTYRAMIRIMDERGVDHRFGRRLYGQLRALGLVNVAAEGRASIWSKGSGGAALLRSNYEQLRSDMIRAGYVTEQEFEQDVAGLDDPNFMMPSPILWAAWGQRP